MVVPYFIPEIGQEERDAVDEVLANKWLTMGETTFRFEEEFAKYINAPYCIAVSSCTAAMFLVIQALKYFKKLPKKVVIPSFTFTATAAVFAQSGVDFEFEDIEPETFLMKKNSEKTVPVHFAGLFNSEPDVLFEDSAHRIEKNSFNGNIACYSFYAIKNITTGEGGMIACDDKEIADWLRKARLHGISTDAWKRYEKKGAGRIYSVEFPGWKYNTTDFQSALGLVQLKKLDVMQKRRREIAKRYKTNLDSGIDRESNHLYPVLVENRDEFMDFLKSKEIGFSFHFPPLHLQPAYTSKKKKLPVTEFVGSRIVTLPIYPSLTNDQIDFVSEQVNFWWEKYGRPVYGKNS